MHSPNDAHFKWTKHNMTQANKIRVAVLFGGRSAEHEISVRSAANVIQQLDPALFEVVPIGIDKQGKWFLGQEVFANSLDQFTVSALPEDSHAWFAPEWINTPAKHTHTAAHNIQRINESHINNSHFDVIFPVLHGTLCEDGTLQGLLEMADLPYVGCGVLSSAVGMDKDVSKRLVMNADIAVTPYVVIKQVTWQAQPAAEMAVVNKHLTYPLFVKPANTGSSIGITKVKTPDLLQPAIDYAFLYDTKVLVEQGIDAQELEVAVLESLDSDQPIASVVGEIKPRHEFYSYEAKYLDENGAELLIPAQVPADIQEAARATAVTIFKVLECEGMARVDLFFDKKTQQIVFNEINTIPGFTQISMYPKLMMASGMPYSKLLTHLVQLAIRRHENKTKLVRSY